MGKFRLLPLAERDIARIGRDTLQRWGRTQAAFYVDELEACFEHLAEYPMLGQGCDDIRGGYRRFPSGEHHIYYRVEDDGVVVCRVRPQCMNTKRKNLEEKAHE